MTIIAYIFVFLFGMIIGSFLNVIIIRWNTNQSLVYGGSRCLSCSASLSWYEMIPIVSFLFQSGRCGHCSAKISSQYPIVEFLAGIIAVLVVGKFFSGTADISPSGIFFAAFFAVIAYILLIISVYDIRHMIIPDEFVYVFIGLSAFFAIFFTGSLSHSLSHFFAGIVFFIFFWGLWFISHGTWMGLGDAKIALGMGLLLGFSLGIPALIISFWSGAIIGIFLMALCRMGALFLPAQYHTLKGKILPFGPFLAFGTVFTFIFEPSIFDIASFLTF